jgi:hypothetical protein
MNQLIARGYWGKDDQGKRWREITYRTAQFIQRLAYVEELGVAYTHIHAAYRYDKEVEKTMLKLLAGPTLSVRPSAIEHQRSQAFA